MPLYSRRTTFSTDSFGSKTRGGGYPLDAGGAVPHLPPPPLASTSYQNLKDTANRSTRGKLAKAVKL